MKPNNFLIVDDDRDDHYFLTLAIRKIIPQAQVNSVYDGSEVLALLSSPEKTRSDLPDLIFLDINMPRICGKVTTRRIRSNPMFSALPIVILTTSGNSLEKEELLKLGANAYYTKPSSVAELSGIITEVLQKLTAGIFK
jgi:CheY-like chemotaxis protein